MNRLSKQAEDRLLSVVNKVASLVTDYDDPNDVIAKVASEEQLPPGHIHLVVYAYNTGRTNAQRRSSDDPWEKSAEFPIADADKIITKLYPKQVKTAAQQLQEDAIGLDYSLPPMWVNRKTASEEQRKGKDALVSFMENSRVKEAAVRGRGILQEDRTEVEDYSLAKKAEGDRQRRLISLEEARLKTTSAWTKLASLKEGIENYFHSAGSIPFNEVKDNSILKYGMSAEVLLNDVLTKYPQLNKQASHKFSPATGKIYDLIAETISLANSYHQYKSEYNKLADYVPLKKLSNTILPGTHEVPSFHQGHLLPDTVEVPLAKDSVISNLSGLATDQAKTDAMESKANNLYDHLKPHSVMPNDYECKVTDGPFQASVLPGVQKQAIVGSILDKIYKSVAPENSFKIPPPQPAEMAAWELSDPALNEDIRHIGTKSMLTHLMSNDPTISKPEHKPERVAEVFNSLSKMYPRAMNHEPFARQALQESLMRSPNDAGNIAEMAAKMDFESKLKNLEAYPSHVGPFSGPKLPVATEFH